MPIIGGLQNPDGSFAFQRDDGTTLTTANTPASAAWLAALPKRHEESLPMAQGGTQGAPGMMAPPSPPPTATDAQVNMTAPLPTTSTVPDMGGGAGGNAGGGYRTKNTEFVVQGASGGPLPSEAPAQTVSYAERAAAGPPPTAVDPNTLVGTANAPAGGAAPHAGAPDYASAAADMYAKAALAAGQGGGGPKPGTYQTGHDVKTKMEGGKDPGSILDMAEANREKAFADRDAAQASAAHEADVQGRMQFARFLQQGADDNLARKREESLRGLQNQFEEREREVNETKIDPDQFWADKSTGYRIGFILAAGLTGALNGAAGRTNNQVLEAVNKRVDENINAQIRNLGTKKEGLTQIQRAYQQAKEQWNDEGVARNAAKLVALTAAEKTARQQASLSRSEAVAKAADQFYSDVAQAKQKLIFDSQGTVTREVDDKFKVISPGMGGSGGGAAALQKRAELMAKAGQQQQESQKFEAGPGGKKGGTPQRVVVGGTTYDLPNTGTEEGAALRKKLALADVAEERLNRIEAMQKNSILERTSLTASDRQKDVVGDLTENLSVMKDQGMVKEPDIQRKMGSILSVRSGADTIKDTRALIAKARQSVLTQGGAVPVKGK